MQPTVWFIQSGTPSWPDSDCEEMYTDLYGNSSASGDLDNSKSAPILKKEELTETENSLLHNYRTNPKKLLSDNTVMRTMPFLKDSIPMDTVLEGTKLLFNHFKIVKQIVNPSNNTYLAIVAVH